MFKRVSKHFRVVSRGLMMLSMRFQEYFEGVSGREPQVSKCLEIAFITPKPKAYSNGGGVYLQ